MPVTAAAIGLKTTFSIGDGVDGASTDYAKVGVEVTSITSPNITRETIDVTHLESPESFREYIAGLLDTDPATIQFNYNPSETDALYAALIAGKGDFQITFPNGVRLRWSGIPTAWKPGNGELTTMVGEFTVKPSGKPVLLASDSGS